MKLLGLLLLLGGVVMGFAQADPAFYVAPTGSDAWTGRLPEANQAGTDGPFATLARARDAVRTLPAGEREAGPVTVWVRGGRYDLSETLKLEAEDSGTSQAPVVFRAYGKETPILSGGRSIEGWQPYNGPILKADVGAQGFAGVYFRQLLCNGQRMDLARYPDKDHEHPVTGGWAYADGEPLPMYADIPGEVQNLLHYKVADDRQWARPEEAEVFVFPRYNWWNNIVRIESQDREQRLITLAGNCSYPIRPGDRYFIQNAFEELDAPGEWYLDREDWTLYFWPPEEADPATMQVSASVLSTIVELGEGASDIAFRGFTFECSEGSAIVLNGASDCLIAACTIRSVGDYGGSGVVISGGKRNGVVGCDLHDIGRDAISLNGGDRDTLEPAGHYADNNYIHHTGIFYKQGVGVSVSGVGNRVSHNLIHDCPRFGIVWGGNDHVFEYNELRHLNLETADCGAIYCWQVDWSKRGSKIRFNYIHDIIGFGWENGKWTSPHFNWGIYLDDGACGTEVYGNLVVRTILGGAHIHGGRDNVIENNIFVDGRDSQMQFSGYVKGGHPVPMITETWKDYHGSPVYEKYPGYLELTQSLEDAWQMAGNKFFRNIVAYSEPDARLYAHYNLPFDKTESDYNLIWPGDQLVLTGVTALKEVLEPNLAPNPGFEGSQQEGLPEGWRWQVRPNKSQAAVDSAVRQTGDKSLRLVGDGTIQDSSGQTLCVNFVSEETPLKPGHMYRLAAWVRAAEPDTAFSVILQAYKQGEGGFFWGKGTGGKAGLDWQQVEATFRFPAEGDPDWREGMDSARIRIDVSGGTGTLWVDEVELQEAVAFSEWEAWQAKGLDLNSRIAEPLFVNQAAGDYRLRPDSPAFELGFKPLPLDEMGLYEDEFRASWPVIEAPGAREQMTLDWSRH